MAVYRSDCSNLQEIGCNDDQPGSIRQPRIVLSPSVNNLNTGEMVYIRVIDFASDDVGCAFISVNDLGCTDGEMVLSTGFATSWFTSFSWFVDRVPSFCDDVVIDVSSNIILAPSTNDSNGDCHTLELSAGASLEVVKTAILTVSGN